MNDTDKLVAAIFAATMNAREATPTPAGFFGFYDACITEVLRREAVENAVKVENKLAAENKAWGQIE